VYLCVEVDYCKASLQQIDTCSHVAAFEASQAQATSGLEATDHGPHTAIELPA